METSNWKILAPAGAPAAPHPAHEGATGKAWPEGARGCEIWCVIGPAPASVADARYIATDTATPYLATFDAADAGKTVHYFLRWMNTRNQPGPWSETVAATIGG